MRLLSTRSFCRFSLVLIASIAVLVLFSNTEAQDSLNISCLSTIGNEVDRFSEIEVRDSYVFVASGLSGVKVFYWNDNNTFSEVTQWGKHGLLNALKLYIFENHLYVWGDDNRIAILNISDPETIFLESYIENVEGIKLLLINDNIAYTIGRLSDDTTAGWLKCFDIANPSNPVLLSETELLYYGKKIAFKDNYLYMTTDFLTLRVIDVSDFDNIEEVGSHVINGELRHIWTCHNNVYLAYRQSGVFYSVNCMDLTDPVNPALGDVLLSGEVDHFEYMIFRNQSDTLIVGTSFNINRYLINNPNEICLLDSYESNSYNTSDIYTINNYSIHSIYHRPNPTAYSNLLLYDITDNSLINDLYCPSDYTLNTLYFNNYLLLKKQDNTTHIYDLCDPLLPSIVTEFIVPNVGTISLQKDNMYIYNFSKRYGMYDEYGYILHIRCNRIDINNPQTVYISQFYELFDYGYSDRYDPYPTPHSVSQFAEIHNGVAYIAARSYFTTKRVIGDYPETLCELPLEYDAFAFQFCMENNLAYITSQNWQDYQYTGLQIVDLSNPENLVPVGSCPLYNTYIASKSIHKHNNLIYMQFIDNIEETYFEVIDISDPENPLWIDTIENFPMTNELIFRDGFLYTASDEGINVYFINENNHFKKYSYYSNHRPVLDIDIQDDILVSANKFCAGIYDISHATSVEENLITPDELPVTPEISKIFPNPFNSSTSVTVHLPQNSIMEVAIFNVLGQQVEILGKNHYSAGNHTFTLHSNKMTSGIYFVRASIPGSWSETKKIVHIK